MLLAASRPGPDIGALALIALVPLLWAQRGCRPRHAAALGLVAGVSYYAVLVSWSWYFGAVAIVPFVIWLSAYWAAGLATIAAVVPDRWWRPFGVAAVWITAEGVLARWPFGGFSWGEVGYAMHDIAAVRSLAAFGGVGLVSFAVVLTNAVLVEIISASRPRRVAWLGGLVAVGLAITVAFAAWPRLDASPSIRVATLQANDINRDLTDAEIAAFTLPRQHFDLAATLTGNFDLIVFPESGFHPETIDDPRIVDQLERIARQHRSYVLANGIFEPDADRVFNRNVVYDRSGGLIGTYEKRHLVPFGEWVPWRSTLEQVISALERIPRDFSKGNRAPVFKADSFDFATVICFESAFGPLVRDAARADVGFIVVSTNNRSYRRSANSDQHIAIGQLRAAETGRPIVHASVSGRSALIDDRGHVVQSTSMFRNEAMQFRLTPRHGQTLYTRFGDWPLWTSVVAIGGWCFAAWRRSPRSRRRSAPTMPPVMENAQ